MTFPLPEGTRRTVYRPDRTPNRVTSAGDAARMVRAALRNGYTPEEVCEAIAKAGQITCKPPCEELKREIDDWLRTFGELKSRTAILNEFIEDLLP